MKLGNYFRGSPMVAQDVGVNAAIILDAVAGWIATNANGNKRAAHYRDGHWWTYGSVRYWAEQFWFLTERQINYALEKLVHGGYLISGNFNRSAYDRTTWYSLGPKGEEIYVVDKKEQAPKAERSRRCKAGPDDITEDVRQVIDKWNSDPNVVPIPDKVSLGTIRDIKGKIAGYGLETFLGIIDQYQHDRDGWYTQNENTNSIKWLLGQKAGVENTERFAGLEKKARRERKAEEAAAAARDRRSAPGAIDEDWKSGLYRLGILTDEGFDAETYLSVRERFSEQAQAEIKEAYM